MIPQNSLRVWENNFAEILRSHAFLIVRLCDGNKVIAPCDEAAKEYSSHYFYQYIPVIRVVRSDNTEGGHIEIWWTTV